MRETLEKWREKLRVEEEAESEDLTY